MHVVFEITNDQKLLNQYYSLREESYREVLSLSDFNGEEDELDRQSDILIARIGELCLGGIRICGSNSNSKSKPLPLENLTEQLRVKLPFLDLALNGYCQWMRLTLRTEIENPKLLSWTSPTHKSADFWQQNAGKFKDNNYALVKRMLAILSSDDASLSTVSKIIILNDLQQLIKVLGTEMISFVNSEKGGDYKLLIMTFLENSYGDNELKYEALRTIQYLVGHA